MTVECTIEPYSAQTEFLNLVVSSPDPTLLERKRIWLQYDIPPDPVT